MDKTTRDSSKEDIPDSTRESLIAISNGVPDTNPSGVALPVEAKAEETADNHGSNSEEKLRSKLISISYSPSPEGKTELPPLPRQAES